MRMSSMVGRMMAFLLCALLLAACGGGSGGGGSVGVSSTSSDTGGGGGDSGGTGASTTTVTGRVVDASGDGVGGALVVVGTSSATSITDDQGRFSVGGAPTGQAPITILAPGYRVATATAGGSSVVVPVDEDPDVDDNPTVEIQTARLAGGGIFVEARVGAAAGAQITDVRAELVGTADGAVLERHGNVYQGTFSTDSAGGTVTVFAIDDQGRHGQDSAAVGQAASSGTEEAWVGSVAGIHRQGNNDGLYPCNASLDVTADGSVTGLAVFLLQAPLKLGQSPLVKVPLSGSARKTGQIYRIQLSGQPALAFTGRLSADGGAFSGTVSGQVEGKHYQGTFCFINTKVRPNPWTAQALAAKWGLSFFYSKAGPIAYQFNLIPTVDAAGAVGPGGTSTLGPALTGGNLAFQPVDGKDLGYFVGAPGAVLEGGPGYVMHGLMGVGTGHVRGVWYGQEGVGSFWGRKNPAWAQADLDAQWQGFFQVTAGPDQGKRLNVQVNLNANGEVTGAGSINGTLTGGNIAIKAGTLTITDPAAGNLTGSFTGKQQGADVTIHMSTPVLPETASMGVYHQRLIGKFYISTTTDQGYYFLFRNSKR